MGLYSRFKANAESEGGMCATWRFQMKPTTPVEALAHRYGARAKEVLCI